MQLFDSTSVVKSEELEKLREAKLVKWKKHLSLSEYGRLAILWEAIMILCDCVSFIFIFHMSRFEKYLGVYINVEKLIERP